MIFLLIDFPDTDVMFRLHNSKYFHTHLLIFLWTSLLCSHGNDPGSDLLPECFRLLLLGSLHIQAALYLMVFSFIHWHFLPPLKFLLIFQGTLTMFADCTTHQIHALRDFHIIHIHKEVKQNYIPFSFRKLL